MLTVPFSCFAWVYQDYGLRTCILRWNGMMPSAWRCSRKVADLYAKFRVAQGCAGGLHPTGAARIGLQCSESLGLREPGAMALLKTRRIRLQQ